MSCMLLACTHLFPSEWMALLIDTWDICVYSCVFASWLEKAQECMHVFLTCMFQLSDLFQLFFYRLFFSYKGSCFLCVMPFPFNCVLFCPGHNSSGLNIRPKSLIQFGNVFLVLTEPRSFHTHTVLAHQWAHTYSCVRIKLSSGKGEVNKNLVGSVL